MLSQKFRLAKREDFKKVFQKGKKDFNVFFGLRYLINNLENCRFAVVVSTKVSKKAVIRNKLKRQTREIIKSVLDKFDNNFDIIVNILPKAVDGDYHQLEKELLTILKKNKLL